MFKFRNRKLNLILVTALILIIDYQYLFEGWLYQTYSLGYLSVLKYYISGFIGKLIFLIYLPLIIITPPFAVAGDFGPGILILPLLILIPVIYLIYTIWIASLILKIIYLLSGHTSKLILLCIILSGSLVSPYNSYAADTNSSVWWLVEYKQSGPIYKNPVLLEPENISRFVKDELCADGAIFSGSTTFYITAAYTKKDLVVSKLKLAQKLIKLNFREKNPFANDAYGPPLMWISHNYKPDSKHYFAEIAKDSILKKEYPANQIFKNSNNELKLSYGAWLIKFENPLSSETLNRILQINMKYPSLSLVPTKIEWPQKIDMNALSSSERGKIIFNTRLCNTCHSIDGSKYAGPTIKGLYMKEGMYEDGTKYIATGEYIRKAIKTRPKVPVKGFALIMPDIGSLLTNEQLEDLVEYIKSVN